MKRVYLLFNNPDVFKSQKDVAEIYWERGKSGYCHVVS
jgi:hypothetical protein